METFTHDFAHQACAEIQKQLPDFRPVIGIVLGSGLDNFASQIDNAISFSYKQLPGFPKVTVKGHPGNLVAGELHGVQVVCLQGRAHGYEGASGEVIKTYVRTLKLLGCDYFLATNAAGSLREDVPPGELMLIYDHINMLPGNPLIGENDEAFGPRFFALDNAYDKASRKLLKQIANEEGINLPEGVYVSVIGPNYETAAEIKAFRILGADAVGMSTVPEVLVANHCGMKTVAISTITNFATGLSSTSHSHDAVIQSAQMATEKLTRLIKAFIKRLP